jgi:predicted Rossmann-fold nucleotide-binding protein
MTEEGFIRPHNLNLFVVSDDASALIDAMRLYVPPEGDWLDKVSPISRA